MPGTDEDYALVIGIDDYKHDPYTPLKGAKRDAEDFIEWLKSPTGGNLKQDNVDPFKKLSDEEGNAPQLNQLWELILNLRKRAPGGKKRIGRRLYIFLAGHGVSPLDLDEAGLVTLEAKDGLDAYLPGRVCANHLCIAARFDEVLLFMDCCRLADITVREINYPIREKADVKAGGKVKRFYAFACALGRTARELEYEGIVRGIFSRVLLAGLKGGALPNEQGQLTTTQLRDYLEREMKKVVVDGEEQVPKFPASEEIVLTEGPPRWVTVHLTLAEPAAKIAVLDGGNAFAPVIPEEVISPSGRQLLLPPGKNYLIQALDTNGNVTRTTQIKADTEEIHATI